jgi:hypothetical protein
VSDADDPVAATAASVTARLDENWRAAYAMRAPEGTETVVSADLASFVAARLDETEAIAKAADPAPWQLHLGYVLNAKEAVLASLQYGYPSGAHIVRHDPARVLREVAARREILARYTGALEWQAAAAANPASVEEEARDWSEVEFEVLTDVVCHLAAVDSEHPDWREEWRP